MSNGNGNGNGTVASLPATAWYESPVLIHALASALSGVVAALAHWIPKLANVRDADVYQLVQSIAQLAAIGFAIYAAYKRARNVKAPVTLTKAAAVKANTVTNGSVP